jgi:thiol:disulfide interchange protein DsbD
MAFPYVLLTAQPAWMKYLPKPGVWMEKFKESMGFLLLATVVGLLWTLGQQVGNNAAMAAVGFLVSLSFAVWLVGRFTDLTSTGQRKLVIYTIAAGVVLGGYWTMLRPNSSLLAFSAPQNNAFASPVGGANPYANATAVSTAATSDGGIDWQPFSIERLNEELKAGKTVFVDFTADWCLTCKVNETTVLNTKPVIDKLHELHAVTLRADWTRQDPQIAELLHKFGRSGVPLYVVFPASRPTEPIVLPEAITTDLVIAKLNEAAK